MSAETELIRIRMDEDANARHDRPSTESGGVAFVGKTKSDGNPYPTSANAFFPVESQGVLGTESAGSAGVLTGNGDTIYVYNIGSTKPPIGTTVLCEPTQYRTVMNYG
jgi:hypothetical protein